MKGAFSSLWKQFLTQFTSLLVIRNGRHKKHFTSVAVSILVTNEICLIECKTIKEVVFERYNAVFS